MNRRTSWVMGSLIVIVIGVALVIGLNVGSAGSMNCSANAPSTKHVVVIQNSKVSAGHVNGKRCDTLQIMNNDAVAREIAFGRHENHMPYDGIAEQVLNKDQSLTVTLNQVGTFRWHDHLHDEVHGNFTVTK